MFYVSLQQSVPSLSSGMSTGVNIKAISNSQSEADVNSSLPPSLNTMPLPKVDPKEQYDGLSNPTLQYHHTIKTRPSQSLSSGPVELLRGAALRNHLLQHSAGLYSHRRTDGTCSAYSSPQIPKKEVPRSKDTLDLRTSTLTNKAVRDLKLKQNTNKNWTFRKYRLMSVGNEADGNALCGLSPNVQLYQGKGHQLYTKSANGNEMSGVSYSIQKESRNISGPDPRGLEREVSGMKPKSSRPIFNMPHRGSELGKVNMAAVAPFRFR